LKCSRCRHLFPAPGAKKQDPPPPVASEEPVGEESLALPFDESAWKDEPPSTDDHELTVSEGDEGFTLGDDEADDELVIPSAAPKPASPVARRRARARDDEDEREIDDEEDDEVEAPKPTAAPARAITHSERGTVWAFLIFLAAVLSGYATLTRALFTS